MGRTGKATSTTIKGQSDKDTKECVSVDTISKLMKDFTCASLMTKATQSSTKDQRSSIKESHATCCEEIVSSLKHFHLKTPVNKRSRLKEKKDLQRKTKSALGNKYNLSVAAIHSQTSVVWPGKLNCLSNKRADSSSDVIIRPSRLSIRGITSTNNPLSTSSLSSPIQTSSSEEKTRIAAALRGRNNPCFGDLNEQNDSTDLSFSQLCNRNSKNPNTGNMLSSSQALPASIKTQAYRHCPTATSTSKPIEVWGKSADRNHSCIPSHFSGLSQQSSQDDKISHVNSSQQQQQQQRTLPYCHYNDSLSSSSHSVEADAIFNNNNVTRPANFPSPSIVGQSSNTNLSVPSSITPERSCSEEMRMEESNVNELASYFEDLLHIPRKMSVMAEMMYA